MPAHPSGRETEGPDKISLSVVVITFNEAQHIGRCLESVRSLANELIVVDSGGDDATTDLAKQLGARVSENPFENHMQQWRWALENTRIKNRWVLALDADQFITPELAVEIRSLLDNGGPPNDVHGIFIKRRQIFRGRWIKHGGYYPKYLLKMFCPEWVTFDPCDLVDHHFHVLGNTTKLENDIIEDNRKEQDIGFWIHKHEAYARGVALEEFRRCSYNTNSTIPAKWFGNPDQRTVAAKKLWMSLPLYIRPLLFFTYRYFFRLGFLDGKQGFIFHFLQTLWFRLLVDIHLDDLLHGKRRSQVRS